MKRNVLCAVLAVLLLAGSALADDEPDGSMRTWVDVDYLLWFLSPAPTPQPLLTSGPLTNPVGNGSGLLGVPSTQVLAGGNALNTGPYNGYRISAGWLNTSETFGVEASFFALSQHADNLAFGSNAAGDPLLARPFVAAYTGAAQEIFVSAPNAFAGTFNIGSTTSLFGADGNLLFPVMRGCCDDDIIPHVDLLAGFDYLNLSDGLTLNQQSTLLSGGSSYFGGLAVPPNSTLTLVDNFDTHNQFYGGQVGAKMGLTWWRFTLSGAAKFAMGGMNEQATINGYSNVIGPLGLDKTLPGGLFAQNSNSGTYWRDIFTVVPQGNLALTVEITPQIKLTVGYTALYISDVARAGDLINPNINRASIPTSAAYSPFLSSKLQQPSFSWNGTDFFAQGINVGLSLRF